MFIHSKLCDPTKMVNNRYFDKLKAILQGLTRLSFQFKKKKMLGRAKRRLYNYMYMYVVA